MMAIIEETIVNEWLWQLSRVPGEGYLTPADTNSVIDGVGDGCRCRTLGAFSAAEDWHVRAVHQDGLNCGRFWKTQHRVAVPIAAGDAVLIKGDLLFKCPAGGLEEAALQLIA